MKKDITEREVIDYEQEKAGISFPYAFIKTGILFKH